MIKELKTFIAVAREGTFAAAGSKIGLTQAAVSAQMQRLEAELGVELFDRKGRSAQLNRMGQQVLLQGQDLVRQFSSLGTTTVGLPASVLVTIGAIASVQRSFLPEALARFHQQFPACRTRVIPGLSMDPVNQVDAGEIDMAAIIRPPFSLQSDLRWTTLVREPYRLIVPADMPGMIGPSWFRLIHSFVTIDRRLVAVRSTGSCARPMSRCAKSASSMNWMRSSNWSPTASA